MAKYIKEIARKLTDGSYENIAIGAKAENVVMLDNSTVEAEINSLKNNYFEIELTTEETESMQPGDSISIYNKIMALENWERIFSVDYIKLKLSTGATIFLEKSLKTENELLGAQYTGITGYTIVSLDLRRETVDSDQFIANLRLENAKEENLSAFENDVGFVTNTVNNLTNYYKKTETYTQTEVNNLIPEKYIEISLPSFISLDELYEGTITTEQLNQLKADSLIAIKVVIAEDTVQYLLPHFVYENTENNFQAKYVQIGWDSGSEIFTNTIDINNTNFAYRTRLNLIPFKISHLENDSNFITNTANNLTNYYKKTETYTQTEINNLLNAITTLDIQIVTSKPESPNKTTIYLIGTGTDGNNDYEEWLYTDSGWELIGTTEIDLSNYATKDFMEETINNRFFIVETEKQGSNYILSNITFNELVGKFNNGGTMVCHVDDTDYIPLLSATASKIMFSGIYQGTSVSLDFTTDGVGILTTTCLAENNTFNNYYTKQEVDTSLQNTVNSIDISKDWNENDISAAAYIENRTHYIEGTVISDVPAFSNTNIDENSWHTTENGNYYIYEDDFNFVIGEKLHIIIDGVEHLAEIKVYNNTIYAGNLALDSSIGGEDTGEEFLIIRWEAS